MCDWHTVSMDISIISILFYTQMHWLACGLINHITFEVRYLNVMLMIELLMAVLSSHFPCCWICCEKHCHCLQEKWQFFCNHNGKWDAVWISYSLSMVSCNRYSSLPCNFPNQLWKNCKNRCNPLLCLLEHILLYFAIIEVKLAWGKMFL